VNEDDEQISRFESLQPSRFYQLERFELIYPITSSDEPLTHQLTIILRPDIRIPYPQLVLTFLGVHQLRLDTTTYGAYGELHGFTVRSIRERKWEGLHYRVQDEEETLTFYCDTFEAEVRVMPPEPTST